MLPTMLPVTELPVTEGNVTELSVTSNASVTRKAALLLDVTVLLDLRRAAGSSDGFNHRRRNRIGNAKGNR